MKFYLLVKLRKRISEKKLLFSLYQISLFKLMGLASFKNTLHKSLLCLNPRPDKMKSFQLIKLPFLSHPCLKSLTYAIPKYKLGFLP
ncbi:hypothetical protein NEOC84_000929|nr:hypothetical protein [Neochlamydia sp. AcF84]